MTGFTHSFLDRPSINEGTPGETNVLVGDRTDLLGTQELRLNYEGGIWKWVAGLYGSYEELDSQFDRTIFDFRNDISRSTQETTNVAAFGEITYEFVPTWKATVGGRIDYTTQDSTRILLAYGAAWRHGQRPYGLSSSIDEVNFIPKLGLAKDITEFQTVGFDVLARLPHRRRGLRSRECRCLHLRAGRGLDLRTVLQGPLPRRPPDAERQFLLHRFHQPAGRDADGSARPALQPDHQRRVLALLRLRDRAEFRGDGSILRVCVARLRLLRVRRVQRRQSRRLVRSAVSGGARMDGRLRRHTTRSKTASMSAATSSTSSSYLARFGMLPARRHRSAHDREPAGRLQDGALGDQRLRRKPAGRGRYFIYNDNDIAATLGDRRTFGINAKARF